MSGPVFAIKQNNREPSIELVLSSDISLVGRTAKFSMRNRETGVAVFRLRPVTVVSVANPATISYAWQAGDTATVGIYECEVVVENGSSTMTWPSDEDDNVIVKISREI